MKISIPYGRGEQSIDIREPEEILRSDLRLPEDHPGEDQTVLEAMKAPAGSLTLAKLAEGRKKAVVIISDHTRPVPSRVIIPHMLRELRTGSPGIDVTLLVATGCHRGTKPEELRAKLGDNVFEQEKIVIHDCDRSLMADLGILPSGAHLVVNRLVAEADLVVAEGFIEPHFFAGFSGGRKSILPGVCSRITVLGNHCSSFIDDPGSRTGILEGNPINRDMEAAVRMAKLRYIVNVVIDEDHKVAAAFAGDPVEAHHKGAEYLLSQCEVHPQALSDIVITSNGGAPLDQNLYQAVKGMTAAEAAGKEGSVIIMLAECADGIGGDVFYQAMAECRTVKELYDEILSTPQDETVPDQWQYQILVRIMLHHHVIVVTKPELAQVVRKMKMEYQPDLASAWRRAIEIKGESARVTVIPNGISVMIGTPRSVSC